MNGRLVWVCLGALTMAFSPAHALTTFFSEDFVNDNANWRFNNAGSIPLQFIASDGPDGSGYVSRTLAFSTLPPNGPNPADGATLFRAQDEFNSSGVLYAGNWIDLGIKQVSAYVRHNAPEPIIFRGRFAGPDNFPGAVAYTLPAFAVAPNVWTQVVLEIDPASPQYFQIPDADQFEGSSFGDIFSDIGHIQIGIGIPAALQGSTTPFTFDLDQVRVLAVPEPAAWLAAAGAAGLAAIRRRSR